MSSKFKIKELKGHYLSCFGVCICDSLRYLVPFVQFKKHGKHLWGSDTFSKVAGFSGMQENTDQNNSEYEHFLRSISNNSRG